MSNEPINGHPRTSTDIHGRSPTADRRIAGGTEDRNISGLRLPSCGMVNGMATRKITVTLDETQVEQIRGLVDAGNAASISGFVQHAVSVALDDVAGWGAILAEALRETGGPLTDDERAWADQLLSTPAG